MKKRKKITRKTSSHLAQNSALKPALPSVAVDVVDEVEQAFDPDQAQEVELAEIKRKSVSGAVSYLVRTLILNGIGLGTAALLSVYLSPEDFGVYGYVTQFVGLFVFFSDIGLAAALVQKKTEPSTIDYRTAFTIQQGLSWLIFLGFVILAATGIVQAKTGSVGTWLLLALGLSFPLASLKTIPSIILERQLNFNKLVVPQIFEQLIYNGVLIFFAFQHVGVQSYTYAILARSILGAVVMFWVQPWRPAVAFSRDSAKQLLGFGAKFQINDFLARVKDQFFYIALGYWLPLKEFGYVQWAKNWSMYPYNLTVQNVMAITFPTFSRLQKNPKALARAIEKSLFFITLGIFPIIMGMCLFIFPLVKLLAKYQKWQPAVWSLVFFSLSIAWSAVSTPLTNTLNAIGKINTTLKLMVMWTVLTWIITPVLVWKLGFQGVALAALIISFSSFLPIIEVKKVVPFDAWGNIWRQFMAAAAMAGVGVVGMQIWSRSFVWMGVGMLATVATYAGVLMGSGRQKVFQELRSLRQK
jgi:O-antigen/teichoic acid export membrane protein